MPVRGGGGGLPYYRYLWANPPFSSLQVLPMAVGRVFLMPIDIPWDLTIDRIIPKWYNVVGGNAIVGIYREGAADTPLGGALVVESASIAVSGINRFQRMAIANTALTQGQYYVAVQASNAANRIMSSIDGANSFIAYYDHAYGPLTDPCPAITWYSRPVVLGVRVQSVG